MADKTKAPSSSKNKKKTEEEVLHDPSQELAEAKESLLRVTADLQNVRRRSQEAQITLPRRGAEQIILALLPTLDHLELAMKNTPKKKDDWAQGVESIFTELFSALEAQGLSRIEDMGGKMDTAKHDVLMSDDSAPEGVIVAILQVGYMFHGAVLRAAKVQVGSGKASDCVSQEGK